MTRPQETSDSGPVRENRLAGASSPYLLQHARNPVDWYPWGKEAFQRAREGDKPVFLSIGYSTCHWCHVMEHESFEDPEVARLLNDAFVCIKVDREELPDVDSVYMTVCRLMTGGGGWPLTLILTPDKKPFFAATYLPKESRFGRVGLMELVPRVREAWRTHRADIEGSAARILSVLAEVSRGEAEGDAMKGGEDPGAQLLEEAFARLRRDFDEAHGGFGDAPKFPAPHNLAFLLRMHLRGGGGETLRMVVRTLEAMRRGGIYDHVGFGFHRYSVDAAWRVPHFEKMLYDQAGLSMAYLEAFQVTGRDRFAATAQEIFTYVLRELRAPEGGFYSAEDADSGGREGLFYLWTEAEIRQVLGKDATGQVIDLFNVEGEGNLGASDPSAAGEGRNVLFRTEGVQETAHRLGEDPAVFEGRLEEAREKLFHAREKRVRPGRDDKILADWNGLMIAALARGARVLGDGGLLQSAREAAEFVLQQMTVEEGGLLHRWHGGRAGIHGFLDDYAFMIHGLVELYEADLDTRWLEAAVRLQRFQIRRFRVPRRGGFFFTAEGSDTPLVRRMEVEDGAVPSGNAVSLWNLLRLARLTGDVSLEEEARSTYRAFLPVVARYPAAHSAFLCGVDFALGPGREVVLVGSKEEEGFQALRAQVDRAFLPRTVVIHRPADGADGSDHAIERIAPFTKSMTPQNGKAAAFVCTGSACQPPVTTPEELEAVLEDR